MPKLRSSYTPSHLDRTTLTESDGLVTVESPTAEEAIDRLSAVLGPDLDIVSAEKIARGGVGGFFAREMVQLTARRPGGVPAARPAPTLLVPQPAAPPAHPGSIPPAHSGSSAMQLAPLAPRPAPPVAYAAAAGTGVVAWSPDELVRIGLPFSFIRPLLDAD